MKKFGAQGWFLIDWSNASTALTCGVTHLSEWEHSPQVHQDNHSAEVDIWGIAKYMEVLASKVTCRVTKPEAIQQMARSIVLCQACWLVVGSSGMPGGTRGRGVSRGWPLLVPVAPTPTGGEPAVSPPSLSGLLLLSEVLTACAGREVASFVLFMLVVGGGLLPDLLAHGC